MLFLWIYITKGYDLQFFLKQWVLSATNPYFWHWAHTHTHTHSSITKKMGFENTLHGHLVLLHSFRQCLPNLTVDKFLWFTIIIIIIIIISWKLWGLNYKNQIHLNVTIKSYRKCNQIIKPKPSQTWIIIIIIIIDHFTPIS